MKFLHCKANRIYMLQIIRHVLTVLCRTKHFYFVCKSYNWSSIRGKEVVPFPCTIKCVAFEKISSTASYVDILVNVLQNTLCCRCQIILCNLIDEAQAFLQMT